MSKRWIFVVIGVVVLLGGWWYRASRPEAIVYQTAPVERSTVENTVSVTGRVEPVDRITLSFPRGGRIAHLAVGEGQEVQAGEVIALLDQGELDASVREAQARRAREVATLTELTAPLSSEMQALKTATLDQARKSEQSSTETLYTAFAHAFSYADGALHEKADSLFDTTRAGSPSFGIRFSYGTTDYFIQGTPKEELAINEGRAQAERALEQIQARANSTAGDSTEGAQATEEDLATIDDFLTQLASVVNTYIPDDTNAQTVYEGFQATVAGARTAVSAARSEVRTAQAAHTAAVAARKVAESEYDRALAGVTPQARAVQEAAIRVAQEAIASSEEVADAGVLRAPLSGTIAKVTPAVGETVAPQGPVAELYTVGAYEVQVYIPEADIAQIKIGDKAKITFDAFERTDLFGGEVVRIALAETVREGVPTYKTTLVLTGKPPEGQELRSGMTADVEITTDVRENVVSVPIRSVVRTGDRTYVRMLDLGGNLTERDIVLGLRGSNGTYEVVRGLTEGEQVVLYVPNEVP